MGLEMDDMHTPNVPSVPTSSPSALVTHLDDKTSLLRLMAEKEHVESELSALSSVLDSHGVNMNTSLLTFDGFPRNDLDIAQIRTTRARIICLRNDYKALMSRIEAGLHAHHASARGLASSTSPEADLSRASASTGISQAPALDSSGLAFAKVNSVVSGSPAELAGLNAGDEIRQFGGITWMNHEKLSKVAETVRRNEGRNIVVKVVRSGSAGSPSQEIQLSLTPRSGWGGRGLLGCHLLPV